MEKIYQPIGWEDFPSEKTPISSENLGKMDLAINEIDDRVVEHDGRVKELERVIESGGGDSQIDPRRIPDMYYKESTKGEEIFPETVLSFNENTGGYEFPGELPLVIGETYTVNWNGVVYESVAVDLSVMQEGAVAIGDVYTISGGNMGTSSTGEPYIIMALPYENNGIYAMAQAIDGSTGDVTVSITQVESKEEIHTIPEEYLGLDWLPKSNIDETVLFEEQTVVVDEMESTFGDYKAYNLDLDKETRTKMTLEYETLVVSVDGEKKQLNVARQEENGIVYSAIFMSVSGVLNVGDISVGSGSSNNAIILLPVGTHTIKVKSYH